MKKNTIAWLLAVLPLFGLSQGIRANLYDKFLKKHRLETEAVSFSGLPADTKLQLAFTAIDSLLYLNLSGTGWGTRTVDKGDELKLLFSNDSVVTLRSVALQGFEPGLLQNSYQHQYALAVSQLAALTKYSLSGLRKYSFATFTDLKIPQQNAAKLTALSALFLREIRKSRLVDPLVPISVKNIRNHIGDSVQFCSKVFRTRYFEGSAEGPTLLDVQADFSDPFVNVVILEKDRAAFSGAPEKKYLDKEVCISGVVSLRNNIPYLVVHRPEQLLVTSPVSLSEVGLFTGDSVTVTGDVFTVRPAPEGGNGVTLLNLGAPYPNQLLTLVIEAAHKENFSSPASYLQNTLRVTGRVEDYKGKPQMVLHQKSQVQVVAAPPPTVALPAAPDTAALVQQQAPIEVSIKPVVEEKKVPEETVAEFPGGDSAFRQFIRRNLVLPENLGTTEEKSVTLAFEVDAKGIWRNMRLLTSAGTALDKELIRVLKRMPKWKPATRKGVAVASKVVQPVVLVEKPAAKPAF